MDEHFRAAFPESMAKAVAGALAVMPAADHDPVGDFAVAVEGELLRVPYRIYNAEPNAALLRDDRSADALACLYTRHSDGHVRHRHLRKIVSLSDPWVAPYVVQLIGEYVIEIVIEIRNRLTELNVEGSAQQAQYGAFVADNAAYLGLTGQRVISYWDCYYRDRYPDLNDYPAVQLLTALKRAAVTHRSGDIP